MRIMVSSAATAEGQRCNPDEARGGGGGTLFNRNGYAATGSRRFSPTPAPYGSLYHWFPGGKRELGVAALEHGGERYRQLIESGVPDAKDVAEAADSFVWRRSSSSRRFRLLVPRSRRSPRVASTGEPMRVAAASAFESWLAVLEQRFAEAGMTARPARGTWWIFALLEGSLLLAHHP
ncbi:TetR/AcrR family transcriptional regulator [Pseudonocardia sp. MCCB 268]|nr:TetR/AcrR family transcriptional regulator [Pseudonocardia cytotoxica]